LIVKRPAHFRNTAINDWITQLIEDLGYAGVALLMLAENVFPPIPSELVMPLAGFTSGAGDLIIVGVIVAGIIGTTAGAFLWYTLARRLGGHRLRRLANRHGRWLTISAAQIDDLEDWFTRHCKWAVPLAHVVPGLRTLVSIPAGIFEMRPLRFALLTILGAGIWTSLLAAGGFWLGSEYTQIEKYLGPVSAAIMGGLLVFYVYRVITFKPRVREAAASDQNRV
jgi:membrane protein DedA with SNARE-associated domain